MENPKSVFDLLKEKKASGYSESDIYRQVTGYLERKARENRIPYHGHFELTPLCNLNCEMCYIHLSKAQMQDKNLIDGSTWINLMRQAIEAGMVTASLSGGECLSYPDFDDVFIFLKSQGVATSVLTNGVLLNKKRISFFEQHSPKGIQVTLYGNSEDVYEKVTGKRVFSIVLNNLLAAKEAGLPVHVLITPSVYMRDAVKDTILLADKISIPWFVNSGLITPRAGTGRECSVHDISIDEYVELFCFVQKLLRGKPPVPSTTVPPLSKTETEVVQSGLKCGAGRSSFSIRWDGTMHPCSDMDSIEADPLNVGFLDAWKSIGESVSRFPSFKKCVDCQFSHACSFCAAENERQGSRNRLNPRWCEKAWKMVARGLINTPQCEIR